MKNRKNVFYVPWADISEWKTVKEQILSSDINEIIRAYETILMWKLKYDSLPTYIESTHSLLQVMVKEYEMTKNNDSTKLFSEHDLQLSYSTALIRFVNHVSSISSYKGTSLYLAAKTQNIPDWIINLRHDAAHGQDLPNLDALHVAAELSLKWLLDNYWANPENFKDKTMDISLCQNTTETTLDIDINAKKIFEKGIQIWELCFTKNISHVLKEEDGEIFLNLDEMLGLFRFHFSHFTFKGSERLENITGRFTETDKNENLNTSRSPTVQELEKLLIKFFKRIAIVSDQNKNALVVSLLESSFLGSTAQPKKWTEILGLIQRLNVFSVLLEILFNMAGSGNEIASKWLTILAPSLRLLKKQWAMFRFLKKQSKNTNIKQLKIKIKKTCNFNKEKPEIVLKIYRPPNITLDTMKSVLLNPEAFTPKEIFGYLKLAKPPLVKETMNLIKEVMKIQIGGEINEDMVDSETDKVYTLEDLQNVDMENVNLPKEESTNENNGWTKSSIDIHSWSKCPLGLLPFQLKVDCELPKEITWRRIPSTKEISIPLTKHSVQMKKQKEDILDKL